MNLLLLSSTWSTLIIVFVVIALIIVAIAFAIWLNKKFNKQFESTTIDFRRIDAKSQLVRHIPYLWPKELEFYDMFRMIIPKQLVIVPKVAMDKIVKPHGSLIMYNAVKSKYVDFCIFKRSNMEPVVVIDCYYPSLTDIQNKELDIVVQKALDAVNIPVLKFEILDSAYDTDLILKTLLDTLNPVTLAELRREN